MSFLASLSMWRKHWWALPPNSSCQFTYRLFNKRETNSYWVDYVGKIKLKFFLNFNVWDTRFYKSCKAKLDYSCFLFYKHFTQSFFLFFSLSSSSFFILLLILLLLHFDRNSCLLSWLQTLYVWEDSLEFLIFLSLPLSSRSIGMQHHACLIWCLGSDTEPCVW